MEILDITFPVTRTYQINQRLRGTEAGLFARVEVRLALLGVRLKVALPIDVKPNFYLKNIELLFYYEVFIWSKYLIPTITNKTNTYIKDKQHSIKRIHLEMSSRSKEKIVIMKDEIERRSVSKPSAKK